MDRVAQNKNNTSSDDLADGIEAVEGKILTFKSVFGAEKKDIDKAKSKYDNRKRQKDSSAWHTIE